jgi:hypothetical protein
VEVPTLARHEKAIVLDANMITRIEYRPRVLFP